MQIVLPLVHCHKDILLCSYFELYLNLLHQYIEIDHPNTADETLEAIFTRRETTRQIFEIVNACTPTLRRRFFRYSMHGKLKEQICNMVEEAVNEAHSSIMYQKNPYGFVDRVIKISPLYPV